MAECPTPAKRAYDSREAALEDLRRIWRTLAADGQETRAAEEYLCRCGAWHTTSHLTRSRRRGK